MSGVARRTLLQSEPVLVVKLLSLVQRCSTAAVRCSGTISAGCAGNSSTRPYGRSTANVGTDRAAGFTLRDVFWPAAMEGGEAPLCVSRCHDGRSRNKVAELAARQNAPRSLSSLRRSARLAATLCHAPTDRVPADC